jgi:hypothetical protein
MNVPEIMSRPHLSAAPAELDGTTVNVTLGPRGPTVSKPGFKNTLARAPPIKPRKNSEATTQDSFLMFDLLYDT